MRPAAFPCFSLCLSWKSGCFRRVFLFCLLEKKTKLLIALLTANKTSILLNMSKKVTIKTKKDRSPNRESRTSPNQNS